MCACAIVLVVLIALGVAFVTMRKKTAPVKAAPLVPSTFTLSTR